MIFPPPLPTGAHGPICLRGMLLPYGPGGFVLVGLPGAHGRFAPVFTTIALLEAFMRANDLAYERVKQVADPDVFFRSMTGLGIQLVADPHMTAEGRCRYRLLVDGSKPGEN